MQPEFSHIQHWIFDLDHTLYSPEALLFDQIEKRMTRYVQDILNVDQARADYLRKHYWQTYGTTLAGLMTEHEIDPEPYMAFVHDINLDCLSPDLELSNLINDLNGTAIVYTNGSQTHAKRVTDARGLANCFSELYGAEHANYIPKPRKEAFEAVLELSNIDPKCAVMIEDDPRNLEAPHDMGMTTVLVGQRHSAPHVHYYAPDLNTFLRALLLGNLKASNVT